MNVEELKEVLKELDNKAVVFIGKLNEDDTITTFDIRECREFTDGEFKGDLMLIIHERDEVKKGEFDANDLRQDKESPI